LPILLAVILAVIFDPVHGWLRGRMPKWPRLAALLATLAVALSVIAPTALVFSMAGVEISDLVTRFDADKVVSRLERWRSMAGLDFPRAEDHRRIEELALKLNEHVARGGSLRRRLELIAALDKRLGTLETETPIAVDSPAGEKLVELERLLKELQEDEPVPPPDDVKDPPGLDISERQVAAEKVVTAYHQLESAMLGGPLRRSLKKLVNPDFTDIRRWLLEMSGGAASSVVSATGRTGAVVVRTLFMTAIMLVAIYFFFADGPKMIEAASRLSPLDKRYERELLSDFSRTSRTIVMATLLSAVVQGVLAGFGYWLAGVEAVFLLILLTIVLAMVPFLGAAAIWLPVALYVLVIEERIVAGVLLIVYGVAVVSLSDNVVRPLVLKSQMKLHPLLALLSVLGGVQALGPVGIFVGPMVVVFLLTLLKIVHRELMALSTRRAAGAD
jgi:predicted PurR-regulated permease PerM